MAHPSTRVCQSSGPAWARRSGEAATATGISSARTRCAYSSTGIQNATERSGMCRSHHRCRTVVPRIQRICCRT
ncbi:hypothetical protein GCM10023220_40590 [Streptomyces ziwulingensis]|uniref:Uncharacterized protein n=1 Tax=Streptomyces ziwulingensis TaxID=1045501 RepID=A0ABP9CD40_9ACTN